MMDINVDLFQRFKGFLIKKLKRNSAATRPENSNKRLITLSNQELADDLHKRLIEKFKKQFTVYLG